jgi:hypothetical protein
MYNKLARMLGKQQEEDENPFIGKALHMYDGSVAPDEEEEGPTWWDRKTKKLAAPHGPRWRAGLSKWFSGLGNYWVNQ